MSSVSILHQSNERGYLPWATLKPRNIPSKCPIHEPEERHKNSIPPTQCSSEVCASPKYEGRTSSSGISTVCGLVIESLPVAEIGQVASRLEFELLIGRSPTFRECVERLADICCFLVGHCRETPLSVCKYTANDGDRSTLSSSWERSYILYHRTISDRPDVLHGLTLIVQYMQ